MDRKGHTRAMKDPQRSYELLVPAATEHVASVQDPTSGYLHGGVLQPRNPLGFSQYGKPRLTSL